MRILVFYGSYRVDRIGIRLARYVTRRFGELDHEAELIDAAEIGLPMLDRMYKEYAQGEAPAAMELLAGKIREADACVFVTGEHNWGRSRGSRTSPTTSSRNGSGGRRRSLAIRPGASAVPTLTSSGTGSCPNWE